MEKIDSSFRIPHTYAVWSKDARIRFESTSGGVFSEFAKFILECGGVVIGAAYSNNNTVKHIAIDRLEDLCRLRQSKYISSSLGTIFEQTKKYLTQGKLVGFCGAPCQVSGLYSFLNKDYDNLFTMDFICRGMNSPKAFLSWLHEIEVKENKKVTRVWFKYKVGGWKSSPRRTRLDFEDHSYKVYSEDENLFMLGYLNSTIYIRPCCFDCKFKGVAHDSDVTFADFWGVENKYDDDKGTSLLLVNSDKGELFFNKIKNNLYVYENLFENVVKKNPMQYYSVKKTENSDKFFYALDSQPFSSALKKYGKISSNKSFFIRVRKIVKKIIFKLH